MSRIETAGAIGHFTDYIIEGLFGDAACRLVPRYLVKMQVKTREQGIVIEHLLEVWHQPVRIHRVTMETSAELVIDTSGGHLATRVFDNL